MKKLEVPKERLRDVPLKRLLIVWSPQDIDREHISTLCDGLVSQGIWALAMPCYSPDPPDIRIFDLDGAPAPDSGLIQQLLASVVETSNPETCPCPTCKQFRIEKMLAQV